MDRPTAHPGIERPAAMNWSEVRFFRPIHKPTATMLER